MEKKDKRVGILLSKEIIDMIDSYRKDAPGIPDRTKAIREMIELGYKASKNKDSGGRDK